MKQSNRKSIQSQLSKNTVSDGIDEEYSAELADQDDIEAQARAKAADERAKRKQ
jgi:hypothetical protein